MNFTTLPLHDAVLDSIQVSWKAGLCVIQIHPVGLPAHRLVFEGFEHLELPKMMPWGYSCSINTLCEPLPGQFEIELQSGDVLRLKARHWDFRVGALT